MGTSFIFHGDKGKPAAFSGVNKSKTLLKKKLFSSLQFTACVFTFKWNVHKHRVAELSELFPTRHFASDPNLVVDASPKRIKRPMCLFPKVCLW